jgi:cytochrome c
MKPYLAIAVLFCLLLSCGEQGPQRVLVFSKTAGYRHESIETGKPALIELGKKNGFEVDTTEDASLINEENLKKYNAVIFLSTTLNVLDVVQQNDLKRFIQAGGGYVGIHAAADTEYEWPWYGKLVGAYFKSHPKTQEAKIKKLKPFATEGLPDEWVRTDEWYNYKNISDDIQVVLALDETSYEGGENGDNHPIAWYHDYDGGRSFYTGLGHTKESYSDSLFMGHLYQGIKYAMGDAKPDYSQAKAKRAPEDNRFSKVVLDFNLDEPTELVVLPDNNILFTERKGKVKYYDAKAGKTEVIYTFPVSTKYNPDKLGKQKEAEDGLLGVALDPGFEKNNWIYFYYSPPEGEPRNSLVRYTLNGKQLDESTKKVVLDVPVQRDQCCHTGGSITFDKQGNLYLSTGDNTSPFESNGFSPSDEEEGRSPFDAQKSSSNTNDLRGKILRIHPEPDGTYTIPEGNLFPKGEANTRPEIYVMGTRNPYRISVDSRTGFLYWGEVGPDAGENDSLRGPRGYDEVNQAQKAGFFGWPYFVGKNYPYARYDFGDQKVISMWDPEKPLNESPNNTGKKELPAVSKPFIWYPYAKSDEFPMTKTGGRNAMAGPVYYSEDYKGVPTAFPDYFDGKLLIYDWMRNWMFLVSMDDKGAIVDIEPFMEDTKFNNIIDMTYGPDGKLYMIEYGTGWFRQNIDARLVRIDYNGGNRAPVAALTADKTSGATPLTVNFTTTGTKDHDGDSKLTYSLETGGKTYKSDNGSFTVTYDTPQAYNVVLTVTDSEGATGTAKTQVIAGNEPPSLKAEITGGNKTFFFPGVPVQYAVEVTDKEDGSTAAGTIPAQDVTITFDYMKGFDRVQIAQGHQQAVAALPGKGLMERSDCKACHLLNERSAGPSYKEITAKYKDQQGSVDLLAAKIIKGGAGVWGTTEMAAHPQISVEDARKMVDYIFFLGSDKSNAVSKMPLKGKATPGNETDGAYVLSASYNDKTVNNLPSLSAAATAILRAPVLTAGDVTDMKNASRGNFGGRGFIDNVKNGSHVVFGQVDLTGVKSLTPVVTLFGDVAGGSVEVRLGSLDGKVIGSTDFKNATRIKVADGVESLSQRIPVGALNGKQDLYLVFKNASAGDKKLFIFSQLGLSNK